MNASPILVIFLALVSFALPACSVNKEEHTQEVHKITVTSSQAKSVTLTQQFVCQIHSRRHIQVRALERGYLEAIPVKEGQWVKTGELMFKVMPVLYQAKLDAEKATAQSAKLQLDYSKKLLGEKVVSENEVALYNAKVLKAEANVNQAQAELNFATIKAPFDGVVDRLRHQQGSLVEKGDVLTTLSDNSVMWVYFNVPETRYFEYMSRQNQPTEEPKIELLLANGEKFPQVGTIGAIEADFNNATGNIPFRADFPNPDHLLRNGQTGTIWISRMEHNAIVIPQRAAFETLNKRYVYVVDKDDVASRREIAIEHELDDLFVIKTGLGADEKIVLEGARQVRDGEQVKYTYCPPAEVIGGLKYHAE